MTSTALDRELHKALKEQAQREREALKLYEPTPFQERYHACTKFVCLMMAGNQVGKALRNGEPVLTPTGWVPIESLMVGDLVYGSNGLPCKVTGVFPQGYKQCYRMQFCDGAKVDVCEDHLWKAKLTKGERFGERGWGVYSTNEIIEKGGMNPTPIQRAIIPAPKPIQFQEKQYVISPYILGVLLGDGSITHRYVSFCTLDEHIVDEVRGELPPGMKATHCKTWKNVSLTRIDTRYGKNPIRADLQRLGLAGCGSATKFIPDEYLRGSVAQRTSLLQGLMDTDGSCAKKTDINVGGSMEYCTVSPRLADNFCELVRSLGGKVKCRWRVTHFTHKGVKKAGLPSARIRVRMPDVKCFRLPRKLANNLRPTSTTDDRVLYKIRDIGYAECTCISVDSPDRTFVTRDYIVTHNSLAGFAELARAVTGQDPHDKYPKQNGIAIVVGYEERHIGMNIYRYLFQPNAFKIIKDKETGKWRTYRPWSEEDQKRKEERRPAPPLIPRRFVEPDGFTWLKRNKNIFSSVRFKSGWILHAGNSQGAVIQGIQADLVHFDEDIERDEWYDEMAARCLMRRGKIRWTAMPQEKTESINTICEAADTDPGSFEVIQATCYENPFMDKEALENLVKVSKARGHDVYRRRVLGERTVDSVRMYPMWSEVIHDVMRQDDMAERPNYVKQIMQKRAGVPPKDWCRYMFVDPGHTCCAVTFWAVPPPELGEQKVCYDGLYIRGCTAKEFAKQAAKKVGSDVFQSFIIDMHGGRHTHASGISDMDQYSLELEKLGIRSVETGSKFAPGCDKIADRESQLRSWLDYTDSDPVLLFVLSKDGVQNPDLTDLCTEMKKFKKARIKGTVQDTGARKVDTHAIETVEYAAAHGMSYKPQPRQRPGLSPIERAKRFWDDLDARIAGRSDTQSSIPLSAQGHKQYAR